MNQIFFFLKNSVFVNRIYPFKKLGPVPGIDVLLFWLSFGMLWLTQTNWYKIALIVINLVPMDNK